MAWINLEEAGRRLVQQRQNVKDAGILLAKHQEELKAAEVQFQAQYEEERRSFEAHMREVRESADERDKRVATKIEEVRPHYSEQPEKLEAFNQKLDGALRQMRTGFERMEAQFAARWKDAERIIAQK